MKFNDNLAVAKNNSNPSLFNYNGLEKLPIATINTLTEYIKLGGKYIPEISEVNLYNFDKLLSDYKSSLKKMMDMLGTKLVDVPITKFNVAYFLNAIPIQSIELSEDSYKFAIGRFPEYKVHSVLIWYNRQLDPCGFLSYNIKHVSDDVCVCNALYVVNNKRGLHYGRELVDDLVGICVVNNCKSISFTFDVTRSILKLLSFYIDYTIVDDNTLKIERFK